MMQFIPRSPPAANGLKGFARNERTYWFIFQDDKLLIRKGSDRAFVPVISGPLELGLSALQTVYLGYVEEGGTQTECYAAEVDSSAPLPDDVTVEGLRALYPLFDEPLVNVAGRAVQLVAFNRTHQFCGQCGGRMIEKTEERARCCPQCGQVSYPRLSPAINVGSSGALRVSCTSCWRAAPAFQRDPTACWQVSLNLESLWKSASCARCKRRWGSA